MNKNLYRIVFNKARGMMMVVPEIAGTHCAGSTTAGSGHRLSQLIAGISPLTLFTSLALGLMSVSLPANANIIADKNAPGNQQPTVISSGNGTPQVNIQTPSAGGVSRNTYSQFDVDQRGAILNNANAPTNTQLGGYVAGNPWLAKGEAKIILNEVNSRDPSKLNGYIEVAGKKAQVVIANPAGITCDGCGFINANRATLTTGTPVINNGNLEGYTVQQGKIIVQGKGLDSSQQDYTDLIARSVDVNAGIWANELKVVTGKNKVSADAKQIEKLGNSDADSPQFSVDVAALGGMYANSIHLIGTENGVGVRNAGTIGTQAGSVVVTADGRIVNSGTISSAQDIRLSSQQDLSNSGTIYAKNDVEIGTQGQIINTASGKVGSGRDMTIHSSDKLNNQGSLYASGKALIKSQQSLNNSGSIGATDTINLSASNIDNSGIVFGENHVTLQTPGYLANTPSGKIGSAQDLRIETGSSFNNQGLISASNRIDIISQQSLFNTGSISAQNTFSLYAASIDNYGTLYSKQDITLTTPGGFNNFTGGKTNSGQNLTIGAQGQLTNQGAIYAIGNVGVTITDGFSNSGTFGSGEAFSLSANSITNSGTLYGTGTTTLLSRSHVTNSGTLGSDVQLNLTASGNLLNDNTLYGKQSAILTLGGSVTNNQSIRSDGSLSLTSKQDINNSANIYANGDLRIDSSSQMANTSQIYSGGDSTLTAVAGIINAGSIASQGNQSISALWFNNRDSALIAAGILPSGKLAQTGNLSISVIQQADIQGQTVTAGNLNVNAQGINLSDALVSTHSLDINAGQGTINTNNALISADGAFNATTTQSWSNQGGKLYGGQMVLNAASLDNSVDGEISAQSTRLNIVNSLTNRGLIDGENTRIHTNELNNLGTGRIYGNWLAIEATTLNNLLENGTAATLAARQRMDIGAEIINNYSHSLIYSGGDMYIGKTLHADGYALGQANTLNNHSATIEASGNLQLSVQQLNNINDNFETEVQQVSQESFLEYRVEGGQNYYRPDQVSFYKSEVSHIITPENDNGKDTYYKYEYVRTIFETVITKTDPAKILAGGNLGIIADTVLNDKSQIVAGNILNIVANTVNNVEVAGQRFIEDEGGQTKYYRIKKKGGDKQGDSWSEYVPPTVIQDITLKPSDLLSQTNPNGSGTSLDDRTEGNGPGTNIVIDSPQSVTVGDMTIVSRPPNITLPNSSLYVVNPSPDSHYLVETDPKFTNYKKWLGSDYMTALLKSDHNNVHKRLGDGFYEQKLITEQIINLTGLRYLNGFSNDEEQFKALMDAGVAFAESYNLSLGIALTSEQMANLTSDIIWMVNKEVTLADGTKQTVLVPQVYARVKPQDLDGNGALLSGKQVSLELTGDMINSGRILAGDKLNILAENIQNMGGSISGANVALSANNDINNIGGLIQADDSLFMKAGNDINITTTTTSNANSTYINQVAGVVVHNDDGSMAMVADNNINLTAAQIINNGKDSQTMLVAGNDLNLDTVNTSSTRSGEFGSDNHYTLTHTQDVGTQISSAGDVLLSAQNDINTKAANVDAAGNLKVTAGHDLNIIAGESTVNLDEKSKTTGSGGSGMTKVTDITVIKLDHKNAEGSSFSGDSVSMSAGNDMLVKGSQVVGTHDVTLKAGNNLTITTAEETTNDLHITQQTKSGLMSSGGIGFTVGTIDEKSTQKEQSTRHLGSTVGSTEGNVTLIAGNDLAIKGSDVIAQKDISLTGKNVSVESVENQTSIQDVYERKQTGVTVALSGAAGSALNAAVTQAKQAQDSNDSKVKALQEIKAALSVVQAIQAMNMAPNGSDGYVGVSISGGTQVTKSETNTEIRAAQGSTLAAGNNLSIKATGSGEKGVDGDIFIKGSAINAGNDITLDANRDVTIIAAANTQQTDSESKSYGGNAGISFGWGGGKNGLRFFADANFSQSNMNADGLYWTESTLDAGNKLSIISGRDTSLIGVQASGDSVFMDVGRDLTLKSLQDTDDYSYESFSLNISGSYGTGFDASLGMTMDKMDSTWASVNEQTGISAGKGGYDITVGNHTQLDGAVIASEATADKNNLDTGTLGWNDIKNKAEFDVSHVSMSIGSGGGAPMGFPGVPGVPIIVAYGEKDSSTTHSAIAEGNITIRDKDNQKQDVASINNDTQNANNVLDKIFDAEKEQNRLEAISLAGEIGQQVTTIANNIGVKAAQDEATTKADALKDAASKDPVTIAQARADLAKDGNINPTQEQLNQATYDVIYKAAYDVAYEREMKDYGTGSNVGRAIQAAGAALAVAMGGGSAGNAAAAASAPYLANGIKQFADANFPIDKDHPDNANLIAKVIGHAVVGMVVAEGSGNSGLSGALGAVSGELIAKTIAEELYNKNPENLTEAERKFILDLTTIATGMATGIVSDSMADAATGAAAGRNAAENNTLATDIIIKGGGKVCLNNPVCRTELVEVSLGLLIKAGVSDEVARRVSENMSEEDANVLASTLMGDANGAIRYLTLKALEYSVAEADPQGTKLVNPIPDQQGGTTLINPIPDQQGGTVLINPDKSGEQGASNTGNQEDVPDVGGNSLVNPIPDGQTKDDWIYISENGDAGKGTTGSKGSGNQTISNDILDNPRVGYGEKGSGSGNKIDQVTNKPVLDVDGQQITVYPGKPKPGAVQEFPSTAKSHGFNDIIDNYAGQATKTTLNNGATLHQLEGSLNGVSGRFEWIVDPKLGGVSHRMFVPNGTINGIPSKP